MDLLYLEEEDYIDSTVDNEHSEVEKNMVDNKKHTVDYRRSDWHRLVHY